MRVHSELGNGFQEVIYQRALAVELELNNISFARELEMPIHYRGIAVGTRRVDFFVQETIMVAIKAIIALDNVHMAQARNYLEAYHMKTGLLINFGATSLEFKRIFNNKISN